MKVEQRIPEGKVNPLTLIYFCMIHGDQTFFRNHHKYLFLALFVSL